MLLQCLYRRVHLLEFFGVLEANTAVWSILAFEIEVPTSLTRGVSVALDLSSFALIAAVLVSITSVSQSTLRSANDN